MYEEQKGILDNPSVKYGTTADSITGAMETASKGLIAQSDLMKVALEGIAKGLTPDQLTNLASAAVILGKAVGEDATTALTSLTEALESGRVRGLKNYLGNTLDLKDAFDGLETKMTAVEKTQAMYNLTMITATNLQAQQTTEVDSAAEKLEKLDVKYKNITLSVATFFKNLVVSMVDVPSNINAMSSSVDLLTGEIIGGDTATKALTDSTNKEANATKALLAPYQAQIDALKARLLARKNDEDATKKAVAAQEEAEKSILEAIRKANIEIDAEGQNAYDKELTRIASEAEKYDKLGVDKVKIANFVATTTAALNVKTQKEWLDKELAAQTEYGNQLALLGTKGSDRVVLEAQQAYDKKVEIYQKEFDERKINADTLALYIQTAELAKDTAIEKSNQELIDKELAARTTYEVAYGVIGKTGYDLEVYNANAAYDAKVITYLKEFNERKINVDTLALYIQTAELTKDAAITKSYQDLTDKELTAKTVLADQIALIGKTGYEKEVGEAQKAYDSKVGIYQREFDDRKINAETLAALIQTAELDKDAKILAAEKKLREDQNTAGLDLYKDLEGYEDVYLAYVKVKLDKQSQDWEDLLTYEGQDAGDWSETMNAIWAAQAKTYKKYEDDRTLQSNDFWGGVKVQMDKNLVDAGTWATAGAAVYDSFAKEAEKQLSDNLFNLITGHFDKLKLDWGTLWEAMLKVLCDNIAKMGVAAAGAEIWKWFGWGFNTLLAKEGIWNVAGKGIGSTGGIPVIAHPGEMIIPSGLADLFRDVLGKLGLGPAGMNLTYSGEEAYGKIMVDLFGPGEWTSGEYTGGTGLFGEDVYGKIWDSSALVDFFKPDLSGIEAAQQTAEFMGPTDYLGIPMPELPATFWSSIGLGDLAAGVTDWLNDIPTVTWAMAIPLLMSWVKGFLGGLFGWGAKERQAEITGEQFIKYSVVAPALQRYKIGETTGALEPIPEIDAYRELLSTQSADYFAYGKGVPVIGPTPSVVADLAYKQLMSPGDLARWFSIFDPYGLISNPELSLLRGSYFDIQDQNAMYDPNAVFKWQDPETHEYHRQTAREKWGPELTKAGYDPNSTDLSLAIPTALEELAGWVTWGKGGLARGPSIFGERGPEWAVPTYEPERSSFLRDVGADPETIGMAIAKYLNGEGDGQEIHIHTHFYIDGQEISESVANGLRRGDYNLVKYVRKVAKA
ncbi:MAG: hypothetical protein ABSH06_00300 [Thermodesulfobacteriota bacterium]